MTENEAIKRMRYRIDTATDIAGKGADGKAYEDMEIAIKAIEEIQQYRALGTVEQLKNMKQNYAEALSDWRQYRKIGTVEECRAAVEKLKAKNPLSRTHCKDGNHPLSQDIGRCPCCSGIVAEDMIWCEDCGQKLDWSDSPWHT